ncbi:MAG: ATPase [Bacteroidales bacterium]|nr:ATPase [Bacteroidales bacterium]
MILIADSGATKTDWGEIFEDGRSPIIFSSAALSPVHLSFEELLRLLATEVKPNLSVAPSNIFFYGTGVIDDTMQRALQQAFSGAVVATASDMLGAARALCGHNEGIVAILGTGSNSCRYDGKEIVANVRAGGYILGDEASGAYMGKMLLADYVKGLMPEHIAQALEREYGIDYPIIVKNVYKSEQPSRYLASFSRFINENISDSYCDNLVSAALEAFVCRNLIQYGAGLTLNFAGSIAVAYRPQLQKVLQKHGMSIGKITDRPIEGLIEYHRDECGK